MIAQTFVAIAETFIFGRLGTDALAGFALVFPLMMMMTMMAAGGMGGGVAAAMARAMGAGRRDDARSLVLHALALGTVLALLFTVLAWTVALFEYLFQVPANRIGYGTFTLAQLKILQEVITLIVFVPFALFYMGTPFKLDYLWAALCLVGAVYFIFRP